MHKSSFRIHVNVTSHSELNYRISKYYLPIVCMPNERFMIVIINRTFSDDRYRLLLCLNFKVLMGLSF
jgi:hypothetical protein